MNNTSESKTSPSVKKSIGLVGIGLMGLAIAERLIAAGEQVLGWDVAADRRRMLLGVNGAAAESSADLFERCDRVILSLPDSTVVSRTISAISETLRPGTIIVDTSTGSPEDAERQHTELEAKSVHYLDATISGNSEQILRAEVLLMAGGDRKVFDKCSDLFRHFCKDAVYAGGAGSGAKMKLVTNLVLGLNRAALAEGLVFGKAMGLELEQTLDVLQRSMGYSRVMDAKGSQMINEDFEPRARLSQHLKDVRLMIDAAAKTGARLPLSETHRRLLIHAESLGLGALDNSAVILAIEQARKDTGET